MPTQIVGDAQLRAKLSRLSDFSRLAPTLMAAGLELFGEASRYPEPAGQKREGGPGSSWYERGQGTHYKRKDGSIRDYGNSEDLAQRWTMRGERGTRIIIGNNASYAPFVKDPEKQAEIMADFNWKTTDQDVQEKEKKILQDIQRAVDRLLAG